MQYIRQKQHSRIKEPSLWALAALFFLYCLVAFTSHSFATEQNVPSKRVPNLSISLNGTQTPEQAEYYQKLVSNMLKTLPRNILVSMPASGTMPVSVTTDKLNVVSYLPNVKDGRVDPYEKQIDHFQIDLMASESASATTLLDDTKNVSVYVFSSNDTKVAAPVEDVSKTTIEKKPAVIEKAETKSPIVTNITKAIKKTQKKPSFKPSEKLVSVISIKYSVDGLKPNAKAIAKLEALLKQHNISRIAVSTQSFKPLSDTPTELGQQRAFTALKQLNRKLLNKIRTSFIHTTNMEKQTVEFKLYKPVSMPLQTRK